MSARELEIRRHRIACFLDDIRSTMVEENTEALPLRVYFPPPEEVVHGRNVIAFFVWAWPSGFCD